MPTTNLPRGGNLQLFTRQQASGFKTAATGNYQPTLVYSFGVAKQKPLEDDPLLGVANTNNNGFDEIAPAPGLSSVGGPIVAPLDFSHAGLWLSGAFGAPVTSGTGPDYTHVFTSGGAVLPERTVERNMAKASGNILLQTIGIMVNTLSIQASRAAGYARLSLDCLAYDEINLGSTGAGVPVAMWARDPIAAALGVYKIDTVQAAILESNWTYSNGLQPREEIGDDRMAGYDPGVRKLTGTLRMRLRDLTLYDAAVAGTPHAGEMLFQKTAARSLSFAMPAVRLEKPVVNNEGPDGIDVTFNMRAEQTAGAPMVTATLKGAITTYVGL